MSTWKSVVTSLDDPTQSDEARLILESTLAPLSDIDAVTALLHLVPFSQTDGQKAVLTNAIAERLKGPLAWGLVQDNAGIPELHETITAAMDLHAATVPHESPAPDPKLIILIEVLENAPKRNRIAYVMNVANTVYGHGLRTIIEYLQPRIDRSTFLETLEFLPFRKGTFAFLVARQVAKEYLESLSIEEEVTTICLGLERSIYNRMHSAIAFLCSHLTRRAQKNPSYLWWKTESLLTRGILQETNRSLTAWMGYSGKVSLTETGLVLAATRKNLDALLPDPSLPHPVAHGELDRPNLPRPSEGAKIEALDLPILSEPATTPENKRRFLRWRR